MFRKPNKIIAEFLRLISIGIIKKKAIIKSVGTEKLNLEPPFLIVSNHVNNLDPVFINYLFDEPIIYVVSDRFYKQKIFGAFLKYIGAISKKKNRVDTGTIRHLKKAVQAKRIIGLFPEGMRNWDGRTQTQKFRLAKLCKFLKIPLVLINIEGGHFNQPRWSDDYQKSEITLRVLDVISVDKIKSQDVETLNNLIEELMQYNEQLMLSGSFPLKGIDRVLSYCIECNTLDNLIINDEKIICSNCHSAYIFQCYTRILHPISNLSNWVDSQNKFIEEQLKNSSLDLNVISDMRIFDLNRKQIIKKAVVMEIRKNQLWINDRLIEEFKGVNVQSNNQLELVIKDRIYWIFFKPNQHIFLWYTILSFMRGEKNG